MASSSNAQPRPSPPHDPYAALRIKSCRRFILGNIFSTIGSQMLYLAVGWEIFQSTNSTTALGIVGLIQVLPILLFSIPAGHFIDRYDRKKIVLVDQFLLGVTGLLMALVAFNQSVIADYPPLHLANQFLSRFALFFHDSNHNFTAPYIPLMLALLFLNGMVRSLNQPAKLSLLPQLVPTSIFPNAATWHSTTFEVSTMIGPTTAGFILAFLQPANPNLVWPFVAVYFVMAVCQFISVAFFAATRPTRRARTSQPLSLSSLAAGLKFSWNTKVIMGTITLDLLCTLIGGATALLPVFSKDILHSGPVGLGWLRAAPSFGAVFMAITIAHLPQNIRAGRLLLIAVSCFGLAIIGFGLSRNLYLSIALLFAVGACDNVSSVIRQTVVQMLTPDSMRGRVSAVKSVFSSASDGLGALESGLTASLLGPVLAVVVGGIGTLVVVPAIATLFPQLLRLGPLKDSCPEPEPVPRDLQPVSVYCA